MAHLRTDLAKVGVHHRLRSREGTLIASLWEGPRLLSTDLPLEWESDALRMARNRQAVMAVAPQVRQRVAAIRSAGPVEARKNIGDCVLANQLDDHQALNVAALTAQDSWGGCVFDEQGTGKTVSLIATFDLLVERGLAETMLVVAPKSMIAEWKQEFSRFTGDLYKVRVAEGSRHLKAQALFSGADVIVVNYETLISLGDEIIRLARRTRLVLAVDESFNVKNPDAARTTAAAHVREWCTHAFVLCGTPAPNSAADIIAQFDLVDYGYTFHDLAVDKDRSVATTQVRTRLEERGLFVRNLKQIVLHDLPGRTFTEVEVTLAPHQQRAYDAALKDLILDLESTDDDTFARQIQSYLQRRATLLRICADPTPIIDGYTETPAKITVLDELLERLVARDHEKVIVWSFYRASLDRIAARYEHYGLVRIDGSVTDTAKRRSAIRRFQEDADISIFLGNPAAAGAGLTLHSARYAIYESLSNQAAHYLQSLDRIHRRGQVRDVQYVTLVASGTVEEMEYQRLRTKAEAQADLLGDPADDSPTRRLMLTELLASRDRRAQL